MGWYWSPLSSLSLPSPSLFAGLYFHCFCSFIDSSACLPFSQSLYFPFLLSLLSLPSLSVLSLSFLQVCPTEAPLIPIAFSISILSTPTFLFLSRQSLSLFKPLLLFSPPLPLFFRARRLLGLWQSSSVGRCPKSNHLQLRRQCRSAGAERADPGALSGAPAAPQLQLTPPKARVLLPATAEAGGAPADFHSQSRSAGTERADPASAHPTATCIF